MQTVKVISRGVTPGTMTRIFEPPPPQSAEHILMILRRNGGLMTRQELQTAAQLSSTVVMTCVEYLANRGFVERTDGYTDGGWPVYRYRTCE